MSSSNDHSHADIERRLERLEARLNDLGGYPEQIAGAHRYHERAAAIVRDAFADTFGRKVESDELFTLRMGTEPKWDSLGQVGFILALEEGSGLTIDSAMVAELTSAEAAYQYLEERLG